MLPTIFIAAAACSWQAPGANRFTGDPVIALEAYQDIPDETRKKLAVKLREKKYDKVIDITRDSIGYGEFEPKITQMFFGNNKVCTEVDRSTWKAEALERAMVFCESGHCVMLPTVCGNLSRVVPTSKFTPKPAEAPIDKAGPGIKVQSFGPKFEGNYGPIVPQYSQRSTLPQPEVIIVEPKGKPQTVDEPGAVLLTIAALGAAFTATFLVRQRRQSK